MDVDVADLGRVDGEGVGVGGGIGRHGCEGVGKEAAQLRGSGAAVGGGGAAGGWLGGEERARGEARAGVAAAAAARGGG